MAKEKCYQLMSIAEFEKMRTGEDYDSPASTYATNVRAAEHTFECGKNRGTWMMVWGDGKKENKVVHL